MKTLLLHSAVLALLSLPLAGSVHAGEKPTIEWRRDFQSVTAPDQLTKPGKPLLLRFFAKWCGPCRVMDARVWPDAEVAKAVNERFTPVEIDIDSPGASALAGKYRIIGVPTIIALNSEGEEISRANFMSPEQTTAFLKEAAGR